MSVLGEIQQDEFILAGFVLDKYGTYHGQFKGLDVGIAVGESFQAWNAWDIKLAWRDVKLNVRRKVVYCDKDKLFEEARKAVFEFSDGCLDICKLNGY